MSKYCMKCGKEHPDDANFCVNCGYNFAPQPVIYAPPSTEKKPVPGRGFGIASMILGFVSCYLSLVSFILFFVWLNVRDNYVLRMLSRYFLFFAAIQSLITISLAFISRIKNYKRQSTVGLIIGLICFGINVLLLVLFYTRFSPF